MQAIFFALISYFTWGSGALFEAIAARKINSYSLTFWSFFYSVILLSFYALSQTASLKMMTFNILCLNIFLGVLLIIGCFLYYEAYRSVNRVIVGTIAQSFPAITVILSLIFFSERTSFFQAVGIFIIFLGMFLSIFNISEFRRRILTIDKGFIFAFGAMITWGIYFAFIKIPVDKVGWFWPNYITFSLFPLIFLYMKIKKIKLESPINKNVAIPFFVSRVLVRTAEFSYNFAISKGMVAIVAPIAGANVTLFVILAFIFFKDPIKKQQIVGIVTTLIGIIVLSLFSGG
jgi:uncharacterized membrane protein